jgi:hypothetical protein
MNKAKRQVKRFINYLFGLYHAPRIPVYVHWHHPSVVDPNGKAAFGVFCYGYGTEDENQCIHVAGKKIGCGGVCSVIAHEFTHYLQWLHGRDMNDDKQIEEDAEYCGAGLWGQYITNKKDKHIRIDGTLPAWKTKQELGG